MSGISSRCAVRIESAFFLLNPVREVVGRDVKEGRVKRGDAELEHVLPKDDALPRLEREGGRARIAVHLRPDHERDGDHHDRVDELAEEGGPVVAEPHVLPVRKPAPELEQLHVDELGGEVGDHRPQHDAGQEAEDGVERLSGHGRLLVGGGRVRNPHHDRDEDAHHEPGPDDRIGALPPVDLRDEVRRQERHRVRDDAAREFLPEQDEELARDGVRDDERPDKDAGQDGEGTLGPRRVGVPQVVEVLAREGRLASCSGGGVGRRHAAEGNL